MNNSILITGANGQLGRCLRDILQDRDDICCYYTDVDTLDICQEAQVEAFVTGHAIGTIINAAAYTAVDKAEQDMENAFRINCEAVGNLANVAKRHHAFMVHISTDYVYDGCTYRPYTEEDRPHPISVYGSSKLAGEEALRQSGCRGIIIRTEWLYSEYGHNFVKTMLKVGSEKERIGVVYDQIGAPTYAGDLAKTIIQILDTKPKAEGVELFLYANEGSISWFELAKTIMEEAGLRCTTNAILTSEYPTAAQRPSYSLFNLSKIKNRFGIEIPYWKNSLSLVINKLKNISKKMA